MNIFTTLLAKTEKPRPEWVVNSFPVIKLIVVILILIAAVFMIVSCLMQEGNTNGMTGITGDTSDTFYNRNRGKSSQGIIKKLTIINAIAIMVLCIVYLVLNTIYSGGLV